MRVRLILAGLLAALAFGPASAQVRPIGPSAAAVPARAANEMVLVDATTGLPTSVSGSDGAPCTVDSGTTVGTVPVLCDTLGFRGVGFQLVTTATTGTVLFEASDDNANWRPAYTQASDTALFSTSVATSNIVGTYYAPAAHRYFRARISVASNQTVTGFAYLRQTNLDPSSTSVTVASGSITATQTEATWFSDVSAAALAASANTTATARDGGLTASTSSYTRFNCLARADAAGGTLYLLSSTTTTFPALATGPSLSTAVPAGQTATLTTPLFYRYNGCQFVNGANAQTTLYVAGGYGQ